MLLSVLDSLGGEGMRYYCLYLPNALSPCSISEVESSFPKIILMNYMCICWLSKAFTSVAGVT